MAVSIVNSASIAGSTASLTCAKPTNTADGDLMIAFQFDDFGTYSQLTAPAGWSQLTGLDRGSNVLHFKVWTKVAASEGASYVFQQGSGEDGCVTIVSLRGADTNSATWIWATPGWFATSGSYVAPTVAGISSSGALLCFASADMNNVAVTWGLPAGMTNLGTPQSNHWATQAVAGLLAPSDPSGTKTFTVTGTQFGTNGGITWSIGIQPVATAANSGFFGLF